MRPAKRAAAGLTGLINGWRSQSNPPFGLAISTGSAPARATWRRPGGRQQIVFYGAEAGVGHGWSGVMIPTTLLTKFQTANASALEFTMTTIVVFQRVLNFGFDYHEAECSGQRDE